MSGLSLLPSRVRPEHQAKLAYVYIRQSSLSQVTHHGESTELQYQLVERAVRLGWPRPRVAVIDDDLGKSAASAVDRQGFQQLLAEIGLARVGLVLSQDASRLARNNRDWYQLLDLCSVFGTLIADAETLYDPRNYHDRLLLGLSGMMSEAELHQLKQRLQAGELHKAERGELRLALPVGLLRLPEGEVILHPDEEIQARVRLVFDKFRDLGSVRGVMRYLVKNKLLLPARPLRGPSPHPVIWRPASASAIMGMLKNPAYAGAYVYGRHTHDPTRRRAGQPHGGVVAQPLEKWLVCIQDKYPAYISWERYLANQQQLRNNQSRYQEDQHGVPRKGQALLQGIVRCGRCGAAMTLHYSGPQGEFPVYLCRGDQHQFGGPRCQEVRGLGLDAAVEELFLAALAPDRVAVALAALEQWEHETAELRRQWQLRLQRARYEAERAQRQYNAVEPENRLVARNLERQWEETLRALQALEQEAQAWEQQQRVVVTAADRDMILAVGSDLPRLWRAESTTNADRKALLRLVIAEVVVDARRARGRVWFKINWRTGASSEHEVKRGVRSYEDHADRELLQQRVRELVATQKMDEEIATVLNSEGFRTAHGGAFSSKLIWLLRKEWGIPTVKVSGLAGNPSRWEDGRYSVVGAASILGVFPGTIYHYLRTGRLQGEQLAKGQPWKISLTEEQIAALQAQVARAKGSGKAPC